MALSEDEQRLLAQMEAALSQEDPHFANTLRGRPTIAVQKRRLALSLVLLLVGLGVLVGGMSIHPVVSVIGFALMLVATLGGVSSMRIAAGAGTSQSDAPNVSASVGSERQARFMEKMEEQWRRRMNDGN